MAIIRMIDKNTFYLDDKTHQQQFTLRFENDGVRLDVHHQAKTSTHYFLDMASAEKMYPAFAGLTILMEPLAHDI